MNKKILLIIMTVVLTFIGIFNLNVKAEETKGTIVYFYQTTCGVCQRVGPEIDNLKEEGYTVIKYNISEKGNLDLLRSYSAAYSLEEPNWPSVFVGDKAYIGEEILDSIDEIKMNAQYDLKEIKDVGAFKLEGFISFFSIGLLDGVNPCALAMLLLFISLLGFTRNKRVLIGISFTYIFALFVSYFLLGTVLFQFALLLENSKLVIYVNWFITIVALILFLFNMYDFIVSKNEKYDKIKLQLPRSIQKLNKRIMKTFTKKLDENSIWVYVLTFTVGFIISLTEFMCTGQVYYAALIILIQYSETLNYISIIYLLIYNLAFVMPLIIVAVFAIKMQSVMIASDFIRRNLHIIKLLTAILFLGIALYYIFFRIL